MRLFRAVYRDRKGERREAPRWYVEFTDHLGHQRRLAAFSDKGASLEFGHKLRTLVEDRLAGERPTGDLARWLESLPRSMRERLERIGLLDKSRAAAGRPLSEHLEDYRSAMLAKGDSLRHVNEDRSKLRRTAKRCGFAYWSDISASKLATFLAELRTVENASIRTSNSYFVAFKSFCRWAVRNGRASESPVQHMQGLNERVDVRLRRRALSADELRRLIEAAATGPEVSGMPGPERAMLYRVAVETGLRWSELRSLRRVSLALDAEPPTVTVEAGYSKHRREDVLPLRKETAEALREFCAERPALPTAAAFLHMPRKRRGAILMRADLKAAGIDYEDKGGRVADFHSLRHSFITALARGGVHPKVAQDLARHSDINLTMQAYTHTLLASRAEALEALPDLSAPSSAAAEATGTDGKSVSPDHVLASCLASQKPQSRTKLDESGQSGERKANPRALVSACANIRTEGTASACGGGRRRDSDSLRSDAVSGSTAGLRGERTRRFALTRAPRHADMLRGPLHVEVRQ